jgi:hypothetical protein
MAIGMEADARNAALRTSRIVAEPGRVLEGVWLVPASSEVLRRCASSREVVAVRCLAMK